MFHYSFRSSSSGWKRLRSFPKRTASDELSTNHFCKYTWDFVGEAGIRLKEMSQHLRTVCSNCPNGIKNFPLPAEACMFHLFLNTKCIRIKLLLYLVITYCKRVGPSENVGSNTRDTFIKTIRECLTRNKFHPKIRKHRSSLIHLFQVRLNENNPR